MTEFEKGYEQGYKDGIASAALPNVNDNGDKIDGYCYVYKTDSRGEPYIHIDSVRSMLKKADDVQPIVDTENMATVLDEFICKKYGSDNDSYRICNYCYFDFKNFIKGCKNDG